MTTATFFSGQSLAHALGWSLLHFCWQGAIIALLLTCVLGLLSNRPPQSRYAAACFALALMILLPVATFVRLATTPHIVENTITNSTMGKNQIQIQISLGETAEPWLDRVAMTLDHAMPWILAVWFTGVALFLGRLNIGLIAARRMKSVTAQPASLELQRLFHELRHRLRITRPVKLMGSALVQVPTVIGWLRPVVLMPMGCVMGLSTIQIEAVLAHELAHIRRHDYLISVFQSLIEALLFYHPAVWWVSKQIRREREHSCDDLAVRISGDSLAYAKALSFLEEQRSSLPVVALGANGGVLSMRIKRLLGRKETPAISRLAALSLLAVVVVAAGLCIGIVARAQPNTAKQLVTQDNKGSQNLAIEYQRWVDQDVRWIITPEERDAFLKLTNDEARDTFIKQFWQSRNPTSGTGKDTFRAEHYRRIAYANLHFAAAMPGWETDRGRIYIVYGRPDSIDAHPTGGNDSSAKPNETWHYRLIQDYGPSEQEQGTSGYKATVVTRKDIDMKFVDVCSCGDYKLQPVP